MAGKTFPGIGDDLGDEVPPLDPADAADSASSASYYSGPTVVDDAKVEQGLKKLRSLDAPPGPLTGIHRAVADAAADARPTPAVPEAVPLIPEITVDPSRGTAVGRSVSGPLPGQQSTQPFDDKHLRGTMFGHGVHLPDFDTVSRPAQEVEPSKALAVIERGKPTNHEVAIFQPGPYAQYRGTPAAQVPYPTRTNRNLRTPIEVQPLPTRGKIAGRVLAAAACIGLIVVGAIAWVRYNTEDPGAYPKPAAVPAARPIDLHPLAPPPPAPPVEAVAPPEAPAPPQASAPRPAAAQPAPVRAAPAKPVSTKPAPTAEGEETPPAAKPAAPPPPAAAHHTRSLKRHGSAGEASAGKADPGDGKAEGSEPKPTRAKRAAEEDPDATMAPTIE